MKTGRLEAIHIIVIISLSGMAAATLGMLVNVAGVFFAPMAEDLNTGIGSVSLLTTAGNLAFATGGLMAPRAVGRGRLTKVILAAVLVMSATTVAISFSHSIPLMFVLFFIRGFAATFCAPVVITMVILRWFKKRVGIITSIIMGTAGIAGALFSPVFNAIIDSRGWRTAYMFQAFLIFAFSLPAILSVKLFPHERGARPYGDDGEELAESGGITHDDLSSCFKYFTPMLIIFSYATATASAFIQFFPSYVQDLGMASIVGATMLSAAMVMNTVGKLVFGGMSDRFGLRISATIYIGFGIIAAFLLLWPTMQTLYPAAALSGCLNTMTSVSISLLVRELYGELNYDRAFPKMSLACSLAYAIGNPMFGFLYDRTGSYRVDIVLLLVMHIISLIMLYGVYAIRKHELLK